VFNGYEQDIHGKNVIPVVVGRRFGEWYPLLELKFYSQWLKKLFERKIFRSAYMKDQLDKDI